MKAIAFFTKEDCMNNEEIYPIKNSDEWFFSIEDMILFAERYHKHKLNEKLLKDKKP